jgi:hypothetical protein
MNPVPNRPAFFIRHPWLLVVFAFTLLIGAWSALITIAVKHAPQQVEVNVK